jgi:DNA polymerase
MPAPVDLFEHIAAGRLLEAWGATFEMWIWDNVAVPQLGWPPLPHDQVRCAMAKTRVNAWPGSLEEAGRVAGIEHQKDPDGTRLLNKFSIPRTPTKTDDRLRILPEDDPADAEKLYTYNERDIQAESEMSAITPNLSPTQLALWKCDRDINRRGVGIDVPAMHDCIVIVEQAFAKYNAELSKLTGGAIDKASQLEKLKTWAATRGVSIGSLDEEHLEEWLKRKDLPADVYRSLEIRSIIGSASIKKLYSIRNQLTNGNLHDLFVFNGARTGRFTGADVQPHNLYKGGPALHRCNNQMCAHWFGAHTYVCPWCNAIQPPDCKKHEWNPAAFEDAFKILRCRSLELAEAYFGNAILLIMACVRGLFIARPGKDYIASDYSAIEGVVTAALSGEDWRLKVFAKGEDIYYHAAGGITGRSYEWYMAWRQERKRADGSMPHHPDRQTYGKIGELSSGFGGGLGAWLAFGAGEYFNDEQIKEAVKKWRKKSPNIVALWGGQERFNPEWGIWEQEYYGLEGAAICAVMNPGALYTFKAKHELAAEISYYCDGDKFYCILPSGRILTYHQPRLVKGTKFSENGWTLHFWGWNTNPKMGPPGWIQMSTYGGKLTENAVQAVAFDILANAIIKAENCGYTIALHVHDELVAEVPHGVGSIEQLEAIMNDLPDWAKGWPLKAKGGWRGHRYRKD